MGVSSEDTIFVRRTKMLEKELVKFIKSLFKFHVWLLRSAIGDFALGLKVLAIIAVFASFYFLITYGTHIPFAKFSFLTLGLGFSWGMVIGGVDMVWKFIHLPRTTSAIRNMKGVCLYFRV